MEGGPDEATRTWHIGAKEGHASMFAQHSLGVGVLCASRLAAPSLSTHACVYVRECVLIYIYMHTHICMCVYVRIYVSDVAHSHSILEAFDALCASRLAAPSLSLSIYLSIYLSICLSIYLSIDLSISIYMYIYIYICIYIYMYI